VTPRLYAGPLDCIRTIYGAHGVGGLFKGQVPTLIREGLGYGSVFSVDSVPSHSCPPG
jgi:solute carrier family 25 carnitine/acylcarnitine transporter 20/29